MNLKKNFPHLVAGYTIAVGVFFCISALIEDALLKLEMPGKHFMLVVSIIFIGAGIYSIFLHNRGKLKRSGKTITETRQVAVEKITDPVMLAQIALEDQSPEVRKTAEKRLKTINT